MEARNGSSKKSCKESSKKSLKESRHSSKLYDVELDETSDLDLEDFIQDSSYRSKTGFILLKAAEKNNLGKVAALLALVKQTQTHSENKTIDDSILFEKYPDILWRDESCAYTPLHWAVHHNNPTMCELFLIFMQSPKLKYHGAFGADSLLYRTVDYNHRTPLELAASLEFGHCVQQILRGMSLEYAIRKIGYPVLKSIFLNDIRFGEKISGYHCSDGFFKTSLDDMAHKVKKKMLSDIEKLPAVEKIKALELISRKGTSLYDLFDLGRDKEKEEYRNRAAEIHAELVQNHAGQEALVELDDLDTVTSSLKNHARKITTQITINQLMEQAISTDENSQMQRSRLRISR